MFAGNPPPFVVGPIGHGICPLNYTHTPLKDQSGIPATVRSSEFMVECLLVEGNVQRESSAGTVTTNSSRSLS